MTVRHTNCMGHPTGDHIACEEITLKLGQQQDRIVELKAAIEKHRDQKADDRCIEDDDELYAVLGDGIKCDRRVGSKLEMLTNCARFISNRCEGGGWASYKELEEALREAINLIRNSKTKAIGPFCEEKAEQWEKLLEGKGQEKRAEPGR